MQDLGPFSLWGKISARSEVVKCIEEFIKSKIEGVKALYEEHVALRDEIEKYRSYLDKLEELRAKGEVSEGYSYYYCLVEGAH
jgi:hypothetical protein